MYSRAPTFGRKKRYPHKIRVLKVSMFFGLHQDFLQLKFFVGIGLDPNPVMAMGYESRRGRNCFRKVRLFLKKTHPKENFRNSCLS
jgi:hypothetical protein